MVAAYPIHYQVSLKRVRRAHGDDAERRFVLNNVTWAQYTALRELLDDFAGLKLTYLKGTLEFMSPSSRHEDVRKALARLLEVYALERDIVLEGFGSMTMRCQAKERGLEPDECYCVGKRKETPDIAIEVALSRGLVDKLEVYRGLNVREVWLWRDDALTIYRLARGKYGVVRASAFLPNLDLVALARAARSSTQTAAVRAFRSTLRRTERLAFLCSERCSFAYAAATSAHSPLDVLSAFLL